AAAEAAVLAGAVADAAAVEAPHRVAGGGEAGGEPGLPREGAGAGLVAAGDEEQAGGGSGTLGRPVERADEGIAFAGEADVAADHAAIAWATRAARASACAGSWSGSARSDRPAPPRSVWARLASAGPPEGSALSSSRIIAAPSR